MNKKTGIIILSCLTAAACLCGCKPIDNNSSEVITAATASELQTSEPIHENAVPETRQASETAPLAEASAEEGPDAEASTISEASTVSEPETDIYTEAQTAVPQAAPAAGTAVINREAVPEVTSLHETATESTAKTTVTTAETTVMMTTSAETTAAPVTTVSETTVPETTPAPETTAAPASGGSYYSRNGYNALNFSEQKGVWISYLEFDSILKNKSESEFTAYIGKYFDNVKSLGFNTVYTHVRAFGDAYYPSSLFPSSNRFNGSYGSSCPFDALSIMVREAHSRGLSIHAWINPMRLMSDADIKGISDSYKIKQWYNSDDLRGKYIVKVNGTWYLNPAYSETVSLIADGVSEIVSKYNVDGIQIDDYFYPTTDRSFDSAAYSASGTSSGLAEWRMSMVSNMVRKLYSAVKNVNSTAVFGISPQGSISNNYNDLYADVKTWCSQSGYVDYILPQIYYGFNNSTLPYSDTCAAWSSLVKNSNVKLVIGLAPYKIGTEDTWAGNGKFEWANNTDIIARQMAFAETLPNYGGVALYRYDSLFNPTAGVSAAVKAEIANIPKN